MNSIVLKQTKDYSKFRMHQQNRLEVRGHGFKSRPDLLASMKANGFRKTQPIRATREDDGKLLIFDGHHRYLTAKALGLPVWFMEFPPEDAITPVQDNQSTRPWQMKDRAEAHAQNVPDYAEVMAFHRSTGIPVRAAFSLFYGHAAGSNNIYRDIAAGTFRIRNREYPWKVAGIVHAISRHVRYAAADGLVNAISKIIFAEGFSADRMIDKINKKPELLRPCRSWSEYIEMLDFLYNHGAKGDRTYLVVETEKAMRARSAAPR